MFLLIAEFTHLFSLMTDPSLEGSIIYSIGKQFHHHPWNGLRFWDLIQPYFMFIVGVAMPYSLMNRRRRGQSPIQIRRHIVQRAFILLLFGWALYCIDAGKIVFRFQNVLAQLSVTYLLAYLVMNKSVRTQIVFSVFLIAVTEIIYRIFPVEGFNHPFLPNENFGTWLDLQYNGADLNEYWVSFNAIPTTAHTIWGVLCGQLLMSNRSARQKLKILLIAGITGLVIGYAISPFTPIIKRICTSSFVVVSGGWTILSLAFSFWFIDMMNQKKWSLIFAIVGMNPLFIYLFAHVGGGNFIEHIIHPFSMVLFEWMGGLTAKILTSAIVLFLLWYICYWFYKRKIFIKI
jgi:predicted acyltransferase